MADTLAAQLVTPRLPLPLLSAWPLLSEPEPTTLVLSKAPRSVLAWASASAPPSTAQLCSSLHGDIKSDDKRTADHRLSSTLLPWLIASS